ncbi:hypothetical protein BO82DRAFT_353812 [Aspergillus uvarum CBS 121591]|uniref:Uncharacterized protein n=1 Tax=Aspergillus uvarum CBS 121591 TaxID=1448315 RepID=A0A319CD73_9EURO|nr:hypothetical protein BO82DRAFT_353812 [Aspergillus uvarum CBS 121591]PYH82249.1 hypothetical protein BO82DRAFT_353812 [Aspergillus uvarum CBS 121591]
MNTGFHNLFRKRYACPMEASVAAGHHSKTHCIRIYKKGKQVDSESFDGLAGAIPDTDLKINSKMPELHRTLPASWYRSQGLYQLERRAVFLKSWYLLGPVTRFREVGAKVEYEIAQRPLVAFRCSGDGPYPDAEEIQVQCAETVNFDFQLGTVPRF